MAISVCAVLTACSVEPPMQAEIPALKPRQKPRTLSLEALSAKAEEDPYTYDSTGRRDPFIPLIAATTSTAVIEERPNCPPLQDFELVSLKLVAIVWGELGRKAMLKAPNGRGYAVTEEMLIGR
ncbi:MAG TPA: hypothetical protein VLK82_09780, partial [Candidatus Tectomicrobia bacterium]|nr:hypothetical protein [Candidatus Tectomicrobia bacterium]